MDPNNFIDMKWKLFFLLALLFFSCKTENEPPVCEIGIPEEDSIFLLGNDIRVSIKASDADGQIQEVQLMLDGNDIASILEPPYSYTIETNDLRPGEYVLKATSTDDGGLFASDEIKLSIIGGPVTDYDGNVYQTVAIGDQLWMQENLKVTHYADGRAIPLVEIASEWDSLKYADKAYCFYDNDNANGDVYGALYTWEAAKDGAESSNNNPSGIQGVCPDGWHLPSVTEWRILEDNFGGWTLAGGKLKEEGEDHWRSPNYGASNESGFTALPGGWRNSGGQFHSIGNLGAWWSASEHDYRHPYYMIVYALSVESDLTLMYPPNGYSVRCVYDQ